MCYLRYGNFDGLLAAAGRYRTKTVPERAPREAIRINILITCMFSKENMGKAKTPARLNSWPVTIECIKCFNVGNIQLLGRLKLGSTIKVLRIKTKCGER